jgi:hypothetical protein
MPHFALFARAKRGQARVPRAAHPPSGVVCRALAANISRLNMRRHAVSHARVPTTRASSAAPGTVALPESAPTDEGRRRGCIGFPLRHWMDGVMRNELPQVASKFFLACWQAAFLHSEP